MARKRGGRGDETVTPSLLLKAYACGIFPMADSADDPSLYWVEPAIRGVLPLDEFRLPRRLARTVRADVFDVRVDTDFEQVIDNCAASRPGRRSTWINATIRDLYGKLFGLGHVHTVEAWRDGAMAGGLYGVKLGAAFFGESMFALERDASKVALTHLVARLRLGGFQLLDTQFVTEHLARFGTIETAREEYHLLLDAALERDAEFRPFPGEVSTGRSIRGREILAALADEAEI
jgi:leucyl/phenylalanyl-tRNA--protein transferase